LVRMLADFLTGTHQKKGNRIMSKVDKTIVSDEELVYDSAPGEIHLFVKPWRIPQKRDRGGAGVGRRLLSTNGTH